MLLAPSAPSLTLHPAGDRRRTDLPACPGRDPPARFPPSPGST